MIIAHRTLQQDSGISAIATIKGANNGKTALLAAQGSVMHVMDPKTLQIIESYPFKTPISVLAVYPGPDQCVLIVLRNLNFFIFRLPELIRCGTISLNGSIFTTRRILRVSSPFERASTGPNPKITQSIRFKENQFAFAAHPNYVALAVASGYIHVIPKDKPFFSVSVNYSSIVDMAFLGPTLYSSITRLAILADGQSRNRELHVVKIVGKEFEEEFTLNLPNDAYMIIPLNQESESSLVISTSSGDHIISAPIDAPLLQQPLSTHVSTVSISHTPLGNDLYLILDAEGGIRAAHFPIEGRPKVDVFSNTQALGGSIIFVDNSIIVSSPFTDMISLSYELRDTGCTVNEQARFKVNGPVRHLLVDDKRLLSSNEKIRLYEKTISCRTSMISDAGAIISIFSADKLLCVSYLAKSILLVVDDAKLSVSEEANFISTSPTVFFGKCIGGSIVQIASNAISVLNQSSMMFEKEVSCASCSDTIAFVCTGSLIKLYEVPSVALIKTFEAETQVHMITSTYTMTAALLINQKILVFNKSGEKIDELVAPQLHGYSSIALIRTGEGDEFEILLGTSDGDLIRIKKNSEPIIESLGKENISLHQIGYSAICSGEPPTIIGSERIFIGSTSCRDIVKCGENFVCLTGTSIRILNAEAPSGSSRILYDFNDIINFTSLKSSEGTSILACHQGETTITTYINQKVANTFESLSSISLMCKVEYQGRQMIVVGTDTPYTIILLDENLSLITKRNVEALPTAAVVFDNYLIVANRSTIDFFVGKQSDSSYELDKVHYEKTFCLTTALEVYDTYLIVADSNQAITIYLVTNDAIEEVDRDGTQRGFSAIGIINNYIFAADYSNCIAIYNIRSDCSLEHVGEFMTDSRVLSFTTNGRKLIYGTEGGGIGSFRVVVNRASEFRELSAAIDNEGYFFINQRVPAAKFEWPFQNMIVDVDNLQIALSDRDLLNKLGKDREETKLLIESLYD